MSILIFAIIVTVVCALLIFGVNRVRQLAEFAGIIDLLILIVGALAILQRAGIV